MATEEIETIGPVPTPRGRLWAAAADRGVPLATIITSVGVVAAAFLAGKLIYRLRDVLLMLTIAGFLALILNPLVLYLQRRGIRRRGWAVAVVAIWAALVFIGLMLAFGYPLVARSDPSVAAAAHLRTGRGAWPWLDRRPRAPPPPGSLDGAERPEVAEPGRGPGQAGAHLRQGCRVAGVDAGDRRRARRAPAG
jgi:hypothetical protein